MLRAKNTHTTSLWGKEFSIVNDGLAEAEVVAFVSELMQQQKHLQSLMELAQRTVVEADQLATTTREKAKEEAEAEASRIVSQAQAQAEEMAQETHRSTLARAEEEAAALAQRIYDRFVEVLQEEMGKDMSKMAGPAPTAPAPPDWQAMPVDKETPTNPQGNSTPVPELLPEVPQESSEEPIDSEADILVAPPIDLAQLTAFQRRLRQQSQIRLLQTVGSWNQGLAITVLIKQPLQLVETLQEMPEVEKVQGDDEDEKEAGKGLRKKVSVSLRHHPRQDAEGSSAQDDLR
jgi:F0F1-type ATP synthase membrane subunit b/b'